MRRSPAAQKLAQQNMFPPDRHPSSTFRCRLCTSSPVFGPVVHSRSNKLYGPINVIPVGNFPTENGNRGDGIQKSNRDSRACKPFRHSDRTSSCAVPAGTLITRIILQLETRHDAHSSAHTHVADSLSDGFVRSLQVHAPISMPTLVSFSPAAPCLPSGTSPRSRFPRGPASRARYSSVELLASTIRRTALTRV